MRIKRRYFLIPFLVCCLLPLHASSARQEASVRQEASALQEASARPDGDARLLVVDYAMAYLEEHTGMIRAFSEAGFDVDYRPYYPAMVERDARDYDAIVLLGGGDPGMSIQEVDLSINFVSRGKVLVLAMPSDGPYGERRKVNPGVHDRYQFNEVLARLDINLHAVNADHETGPVLNPVVHFEPAAGHPAGQGLDGSVAVRPGTRLLVGGRRRTAARGTRRSAARRGNRTRTLARTRIPRGPQDPADPAGRRRAGGRGRAVAARRAGTAVQPVLPEPGTARAGGLDHGEIQGQGGSRLGHEGHADRAHVRQPLGIRIRPGRRSGGGHRGRLRRPGDPGGDPVRRRPGVHAER